MRNSTLVVSIKLGNSRDDGGKGESYIVFHYSFRKSMGCFCFILNRKRNMRTTLIKNTVETFRLTHSRCIIGCQQRGNHHVVSNGKRTRPSVRPYAVPVRTVQYLLIPYNYNRTF